MSLDRRHFLESAAAFGLSSTLFPGALYAQAVQDPELTTATIAQAAQLIGLEFSEEQLQMMLEDLQERLEGYHTLREVSLANSVVPAQRFDPHIGGEPVPEGPIVRLTQWTPPNVALPRSEEDIAFLSVAQLSSLIKAREITSTDLTRLYLERLKRYSGVLEAVVTFMEERALAQAKQADEELAAGRWRGPLHGIPWGAKDLLSVKGYPTTWGAMPYKEQIIDEDAAVVERLDAAGAVLVAKLTLGALAMGDVWFGGKTRNPWNIEQGSSGSSAGPGAAVAAGLVGFAIGSETWGSIVSPATRNGITGLRPTFGRVSRHGAMALSWTMDKLGPMCRTAEDCALVFDVLHGRDPRDPTTVDVPFVWESGKDVQSLRVGYLASAFEGDYRNHDADAKTLNVLKERGLDLQPITLPDLPISSLSITLIAEAAAAFEGLTRTGGVDEMVRQDKGAWPNSFRTARFIPAVEYIQANRVRTLLMQEMAALFSEIDVFVTPSFGGDSLLATNLTGHPCVTVPNLFLPLEDDPRSPRRRPGSITFVGGVYREAAVLLLASAYQQATDFHLQRPPIG